MTQIKAIQKARNFAASVLFATEPKELEHVEQGQVYGLLTVLKKAIEARLKEIKPVLVDTIKDVGDAFTEKSEQFEFEGGVAKVTTSPSTADETVLDEKAVKAAAALLGIEFGEFCVSVQPPPILVLSQMKLDALVESGKLPESAVKNMTKVKKGKAESYSLSVTLDQAITKDIMGRLGNGKSKK